MSWAHVQSWGAQAASAGANVTATSGSAVTAGNLIVVGVAYYSGSSPTITVKDNVNGVNYAQVQNNPGTGTGSCVYWYIAPVGGSGFAVTATSTATAYMSISVDEFSFSGGAGAFVDVSAHAVNALATANLVPTSTDLIFAINSDGTAEAVTAGSGFTATYNQQNLNGQAEGITAEYALNISTSISPAFANTGGNNAISAVAFTTVVPPTAYTTVQAGDWATASTWSPTPPSGHPGSIDTVTVEHAITVTTPITVGNNGGSSGTPAINVASGGSITVSGSGSLTLTARMLMAGPGASMIFEAGTSLELFPPADDTCPIQFASNNNNTLVFNGTSGSPCVLATNLSNSGATNGYFDPKTSGFAQGVITASHLNVSNMGTAANVGLATYIDDGSNTGVSITNCTFTNSNGFIACGPSGTWDGDLTFTNNIFSSSVDYSGFTAEAGFGLNCPTTPASGTRLVQFNSFDIGLTVNGGVNLKIADNYSGQAINFATTCSWPDDSYFARNVIVGNQPTKTWTILNGSARDIYGVNLSLTNADFFTAGNNGITATGFIAESPNGCTESNVFFGNSFTGITLQSCLILPCNVTSGDLSQTSAGALCLTFEATNSDTFTLYHNTVYLGHNAFALTNIGEGSPVPGIIADFKANLAWTDITGGGFIGLKMVAGTGGTTVEDTVSPANADYNGSYNCNTSTPAPSPYNFSNSGNGYGLDESAVPGTHDLADQNPQFVDPTRCLATWGTTQGGDGTATGALAIIAANPALIGQAGTGLLAWVREGFRPQNAAYQAASYPGDPSVADAGGHPWPGGSPGIGAMAVLNSAPVFRRTLSNRAGSRGAA